MKYRLLILALLLLAACQPQVSSESPDTTTVTLLFTNDVESAYDPIPAFWLEGQEMIGGIAEMTTLINEIRGTEANVFLFDSGDIFTGALAKLTEGRLAFELMITMGYDAMAIGNHEFEYGHEIFAWQKNRAPFPVLGANFFYKDTDHPYAQAHTVIERNGIRIGVIGIMGQDAVSAIIPSYISPLDVRDPAEAVVGAHAVYTDVWVSMGDEAERRQYLEVARKSGARLSRLVDELFELAKLDACSAPPNVEVFCIAELAHDVVQKFQLRAAEAGITLIVDIDEEASFASAEIGLIERVLENLIDNALRHTPPEGEIRVAISRGAESVEVTVEDSGVGIPSSDMYYACMDGVPDERPDISYGRFPVRSAEEATWMVDKYLAYDALTGSEPWLETVAFAASSDPDHYADAEGAHNFLIFNQTIPHHYTGSFPGDPQGGGDQLYRVTHGAVKSDLRDVLNEGRWAVVYSGHGSSSEWQDFDFDRNSIRFNVLHNFRPGETLRPFATVGVGLEKLDASPLLDGDYQGIHAGGGVRWFKGDIFNLRFDARWVSTNVGGSVDKRQSDLEATVGASWIFGGAPPGDADGDGVADGIDKCPDTPKGVGVDEFGCPEIVSDGENGYLFEPGDIGGLTEKILQAASNLDLGRRARETIEKRFDTGKNARKYVELYHDILSGSFWFHFPWFLRSKL